MVSEKNNNTYKYHGQVWSSTGCPGTYNAPGWYSGDTLITSNYINSSTGKPYTPSELQLLQSGGNSSYTTNIGGNSSAPTQPSGSAAQIWLNGEAIGTTPQGFEQMSQKEQESWIKENLGVDVSGQMWGYAPYTQFTPTTRPQDDTGCSSGSCGGKTNIKAPEVSPAPAYEKSPEQIAWEEQFSGKLQDWLESGGYGIPEETQKQMIQQQTDVIKANEKEALRLMKNNLERRGITNTGFQIAFEQQIKSNTSKTLANSIRDIQIQNTLLKLASFERAMGVTAQYLGYLSTQSQLAYQAEYATWQAEQLAKIQAWQAQIDFKKMQLAQCYQQQNLKLSAQLQSQLAQQQHQYDLELAQMEIEASQRAAAAEGAGNLFGTIIGAFLGGS